MILRSSIYSRFAELIYLSTLSYRFRRQFHPVVAMHRGGDYQRGGRGRGGRHYGRRRDDYNHSRPDTYRDQPRSGSRDVEGLESLLMQIDGRGYPAYKDLYGQWTFPHFQLTFDYIQGDPYASPSNLRVKLPAQVAGIPESLWKFSKARRYAMCDYLARSFGEVVKSSKGDVRAQSGGWGGEKGGEMTVHRPGQYIIQRSSVIIDDDGGVEARFTVGLPARGRSVLGKWAATILVDNLPRYVHMGLRYSSLDAAAIQQHVECAEDTQHLRDSLKFKNLVAFVGNGSILPRKSGSSDEPMSSRDAVPFKSPLSMEVELDTPNRGRIKGMGIPSGITLIVGGGFHGKSTLLEALQTGIYNKIPGDGRELVVADPTAVKIRAEDGRRVDSVDISPFVGVLPGGKDTRNFSSLDASGSTSQASNIQEALEVGCKTLLIDEDTSATNFMVRDSRMKELITEHLEPITPFVQRISSLSTSGVSTIVVVGGTGEYFSVADKVVAMKNYNAEDVTADAKRISKKYEVAAAAAGIHSAITQTKEGYFPIQNRVFCDDGVPGDRPKCKQQSIHSVIIEQDTLDLHGVEQLVEQSQTRAICDAIFLLSERVGRYWRGKHLREILDELEGEMDSKGLDILTSGSAPGSLSRPRKFEIAAAINRLRSASFQQHGTSSRIEDIRT